MNLASAKNDQVFVQYQKDLYQRLVDETKKRIEESKEAEDLDLKDHLDDMAGNKLYDGDWNVNPVYDITDGADFVTDLIKSYLDDIRVKQKELNFGDQPPSVVLRR